MSGVEYEVPVSVQTSWAAICLRTSGLAFAADPPRSTIALLLRILTPRSWVPAGKSVLVAPDSQPVGSLSRAFTSPLAGSALVDCCGTNTGSGTRLAPDGAKKYRLRGL